jgi:hypothetical protein
MTTISPVTLKIVAAIVVFGVLLTTVNKSINAQTPTETPQATSPASQIPSPSPSATNTPIPSQTPPSTVQITLPVVCPPNLPPEAPAQVVNLGSRQVSLPAGRFASFESPPGSGSFVVCLGTNVGVRISGSNCNELGRSSATAEETGILNQIVASCTVGSVPTTAIATPRPATLRPPDTGSAGLR